MDRFDRRILQFVPAWAPYAAAPDDEVFLELGINAKELTTRFFTIVNQELKHAGHLERSDRLLVSRAWAHAQRGRHAQGVNGHTGRSRR
jgi:hypothetical protein